MRFLQLFFGDDGLTPAQRLANLVTLSFIMASLFIGFNIREGALNATTQYVNNRIGISAQYPQNWLRDENGEDFIFRVRDVAAVGFATTLQINVVPISPNTRVRNIRDLLTLRRAQSLAAYDVINETNVQLDSDTPATRVTYTYVTTDLDPFLQSIPVAVEGVDIIAIKRDQVIVITFLSDAALFEQNLMIFERFLASLEF
jgi:hypothetical protein